MKTPEQIRRRINEILSDERLAYPAATVVVNAPLALIQVFLETELHTLQRAIGEPLTDLKKLRAQKNKKHER